MRRIATDRPLTHPLTWTEDGNLFRAASNRTGVLYICFWVDTSAIRLILRRGWQDTALMQMTNAFETMAEARADAQEYDDYSQPKREGF